LEKEEKAILSCDSLKSFEEYHKKLEESILGSIKLHNDFILKAVKEFKEFSVLVKSMNKFILKDKEDVDKMKKMAKKYETSSSEIIKLNVGGTMFSTLKTTLERKIKRLNGKGYYDPHLLQSLLSGTIKINYDENKAIFIDRNPKYFIHILDYIRSLDGNQIRQKLDKENINEFLNEIEYYELEGLFESVYHYMEIDSLIVDDIDKNAKLKKLCNFQSNTKWKLLYRASVDGFRAADFHRKCDNNANTLTIIKTTENYVFGGYTKATWNQHGYGTYQSDSTAFIFSFINRENTPLKMEIKSGNYNNAIYSESSYGPTFGGHDFIISNSSNNNRNSYSNLGHSYKFDKYTYGSNGAQQFLAGSYNFQVSEIEVFQKA
jgi:hypothetical protein